MAYHQNNAGRSSQILAQVPLDVLKPAAQVFANTLAAELAMTRNQPKAALAALNHPSLQNLKELPAEQQVRTGTVHARAYEADGQTLAAARERVTMAPLLTGDAAKSNHEAIWALIAALPAEQLQASGNPTLDGWITLAQAVKGAGTLEQQQAAIDTWRAQNPGHPAAVQLPTPLTKLKELASQPLNKIALLLPQEGPLATVAKALREGFMAAHYQAEQAGQKPPVIEFYDSSRLTSLDDFYAKAKAAGVQLVVGPLEKPLVKQLSARPQLPITTLALNYSETDQNPAQLFQFGLAAEDEAREVSRRARADGLHRAAAMVPVANGVSVSTRPSARTGKPTAAPLSASSTTSRSPSPSRLPICSNCVKAKAVPRACKAPSAPTSPHNLRVARISSSSSWPSPRNWPSRSSRP